jgi:hypothetical protein
MMPQTSVRPPRLAAWLVDLFTPREHAESILGDLLEEFSDLALKSGPALARRWYWRQSVRTIAQMIACGFRISPLSTTSSVVAGFLLRRFASGLPEPAIFAVLRRYRLFDHHFNAYVFFASNGIAIGHIIVSMFVGLLVALTAKGREMVATTTLGLVLCAMTAASACVWVTEGRNSFLWMLPWNFADSFAIVIGGVIVRMRRSAPTPLR